MKKDIVYKAFFQVIFSQTNKEFVLVLEKQYHWFASDAAEKNAFLFSLWKVRKKCVRVCMGWGAGEG